VARGIKNASLLEVFQRNTNTRLTKCVYAIPNFRHHSTTSPGGEPTYGTLTLVDLASLPGTSEFDTSPSLDADHAPGLFRASYASSNYSSSSGGGGGSSYPLGFGSGASHYAQTASLAALGECLTALVRNAKVLEAESQAEAQAAAQAALEDVDVNEEAKAKGQGGSGGVQLDRMLRQYRHTAQVLGYKGKMSE